MERNNRAMQGDGKAKNETRTQNTYRQVPERSQGLLEVCREQVSCIGIAGDSILCRLPDSRRIQGGHSQADRAADNKVKEIREMISGVQKTVHSGLIYLATKVAEGAYGEGDEAFQDEGLAQVFLDDMHDEVLDKME